MTPFTSETGQAIVLPLDNIDTDQLIPARFMSRSRSQGYGDYLFHDMRRNAGGQLDPDFPLNNSQKRPILFVGQNFGCGSSREAAVYALQDAGIRAVVGLGFADIFRTNAQKNGLLPVELSQDDYARLRARLDSDPHLELKIDLRRCNITAGSEVLNFRLDPAVQRKLILGLDEIAETLENAAEISAFVQGHRRRFPWVFHSPTPSGGAATKAV